MNYGLYLSAAGALTNLYRQDVFTNNLANVNTVGFKPDAAYQKQRLPERLESTGSLAAFDDPRELLEQLGGGQFLDPAMPQLEQGELSRTENPLDVALQGDGFLLVNDGVRQADGDLRLTRDGRLTLNEQGELVMSVNGLNVLNDENEPIRLDPSVPVQIETSGSIVQNGVEIARLQIVRGGDAAQLEKMGENLFRVREGHVLDRTRPSARVNQGFTESSAVDPIMALNDMMGAAKSAQANIKMMQFHDDLLGQMINTFARVA